MRDRLREELVAEEDKIRNDAKVAIDTQESLTKRREFLTNGGVESKTISEIMSPAESDAKRSALHYIRLVELCETTRTVEGYPRLIEQESQYRTAVEDSKGWRSPQQVIVDCDRRVINYLQADRSITTKNKNQMLLGFCGILVVIGVALLTNGDYLPAIAMFAFALIWGFVLRAEITRQRPHAKHVATYQTLFLPPQNIS